MPKRKRKARTKTVAEAPAAPVAPALIEVKESFSFKADVARLQQSHPAVRNDLKKPLREVIDAVKANPLAPHGGAGKHMQRVSPRIYKKRAQDSCHSQGRSGSYRFLSHWDRQTGTLHLIMLWHILDDYHVPPGSLVLKALKQAGLV